MVVINPLGERLNILHQRVQFERIPSSSAWVIAQRGCTKPAALDKGVGLGRQLQKLVQLAPLERSRGIATNGAPRYQRAVEIALRKIGVFVERNTLQSPDKLHRRRSFGGVHCAREITAFIELPLKR